MNIIMTKITDNALLSPSMDVQINEGTEVLVKLNKKPEQGEIVMVEKDNLVLFRRLEKSGRKRILAALNTDIEPIKVDRSVKFIGVADISKNGLDAVKITNYFKSLNAKQKNIFSSMMEDFSSGKMNNLSTEDLDQYTDSIIEQLKLAA